MGSGTGNVAVLPLQTEPAFAGRRSSLKWDWANSCRWNCLTVAGLPYKKASWSCSLLCVGAHLPGVWGELVEWTQVGEFPFWGFGCWAQPGWWCSSGAVSEVFFMPQNVTLLLEMLSCSHCLWWGGWVCSSDINQFCLGKGEEIKHHPYSSATSIILYSSGQEEGILTGFKTSQDFLVPFW